MSPSDDSKPRTIRVQVGRPWSNDIIFSVENIPVVGQKTTPQIAVQVGKPWPEGINAQLDYNERYIKTWLILSFAGLAVALMIVLTVYGWLFSEDMMQKIFRYAMVLSGAVILWAVGVNIGGNLDKLVKLFSHIKKLWS